MRYLEMEKSVKSWFKKLDSSYKKSFIAAFALINLIFLFHTINFMFGDHDWNYIRSANYWHEGAFEGRPLHFLLQTLFFGGHVLPILNNLFSFAALSLSGLLLAKYWKVPLTTLNYTLFATFTAALPLTMVWLFYAKDCLINLSLPLIVVLGLLSAESLLKNKKYMMHLIAIALFYFAFSSYAAVINLIAVCLLGRVLIEYATGEKLTKIIKEKSIVIADILIALVLFKLTLHFLSLSSDYNTATITLDILPQKFVATITVMFTQFVTPIPFMEYKYKILLLILCLFGVACLLYNTNIKRLPLIVLLILGMLFSAKLAFFIADERGKILAEMENFAFVPRLDFYGLSYLYAFGLALILLKSKENSYKVGVTFAIILTFMSGVRDMYAQKVWKLGFDAEMKAHERIVNRIEQMPIFHADRKYKILQLGSLSLRKNYYREQTGEQTSLDLLSTSFTPQYMSRIVYNFYYPQDIFYGNADIGELSAQGREYIQYQAKPWPSPDSIFIDGDIIIVVLTEEGLAKSKR